MIWSVSTLLRVSGTAVPVKVVTSSTSGLDLRQVPRTGEGAADGGGSSHQRRHQVRASTGALPTLEVAIARRGTPLTGSQLIGVHAEAHRAPREAPLGAELLHDLVDALGLGLDSNP